MAQFSINTSGAEDRLLKWRVNSRNAEITLHNNMIIRENANRPPGVPERPLMPLITEFDLINNTIRAFTSGLWNQYEGDKSKEFYKKFTESPFNVRLRIISDLGLIE
ncbi:hypothetical protein A2Z56_00145 [Candidatus Kaiserbacteria bacterium RIFCSPHIGHO2_12_45_16]|nr:MAG: hypothetical protein A2Z56_00145 [Candidatus Kaiserbacteria bacterium RIFCSPHIGHO2_12_45_16]